MSLLYGVKIHAREELIINVLMDIIKNIGYIMTFILSASAFFVWVVKSKKHGKNWISQWIKNSIGIDDIKKEIELIKDKLHDTEEESNKFEEQIKNISEFILNQQRKELENTCSEILKRGYITPKEHKRLIRELSLYSSFGGNGTIGRMTEECLNELPIKDGD